MNMSEQLTCETMKAVFNKYFEQHSITGVSINISGTGAQKVGTWEIPINTFDVHPLIDKVLFSGYKPSDAPHYKGDNSEPALIKLMSGTNAHKFIKPKDPFDMFDSLPDFIPIKSQLQNKQDLNETTVHEKSVDYTQKLSEIDKSLVSIETILVRIEQHLIND